MKKTSTGLIIVLVIISGLITNWLFYYSKQFPEISEINQELIKRNKEVPKEPEKRFTEVPVLLYHHIESTDSTDTLVSSFYVATSTFEKQLEYLKEGDYNTISPEEFLDFSEGKTELPVNPIMLTFDDGYQTLYKNAFPLLKKINFKATLFIIVNQVGNEGYLNWEQIKEMAESGLITIGSHTLSHPNLKKLQEKSEEETWKEINKSKELLEKNLGKPIKFFSYPYGQPDIHYDKNTIELLKKAGYLAAFTAYSPTGFDDNYQIERRTVINNLSSLKNALLRKKSLPQVYFSSLLPGQGDTLLIRITSQTPIEKPEAELDSEKINFFKLKNDWLAITGISVKKEPRKYNLIINFASGEIFKKTITIVERKFPVEEFLVSEELEKEGYTQEKIAKELTEKEKPVLDEVFKIFTPEVYFDKPFIYPLKKIEVTEEFGAIRKGGGTTIQHLGVDLKATSTLPVYVIGDGIVSFSQETKMYGNTLIIDHGFSIFSLYCHLSEFKVSKGEKVKQGDIIGLSGSTGYALGPHLHFAVKIKGSSVDPLRFIETTKKEMIE